MLTLTSLTIRLHREQACRDGSGFAGKGETGFTGSSRSGFAGRGQTSFTGNSGSSFAGRKLVAVE